MNIDHPTVVPEENRSPCIGVCTLNEAGTKCEACGQTLAELAGDE
jgi:predicted Fe-S protein YdhL (DUF1289 family)